MYRWYGLDEVPEGWGESVVTIGVFDGVHRGHQRDLARAAEIGRQLSLPVVAVTFDPHPDEVVRPGSHPAVLCSARRRAELLGGLGVDAVCVLPFTLEFSRLDPDEFVRTVLADRLHAAAVVVGEDFRFGHKAAGDVQLLAKLGEKYDFVAEGCRCWWPMARRSPPPMCGRCWRPGTWPPRRRRWAARTASRGRWSAGTSAAGSWDSRPPTCRRCRTPPSPPTACTRGG